MPLFFFDFSLDGSLMTDDMGTEFPSLEEAYLDTCRAALDISFEKLGCRADPHMDWVDIFDAERRPLMHVPFSDALRPKPSRIPTPQRSGNQTIDSCRREMARGKALRAEIGVELRRVQSESLAIQASLERLRRRQI